MKSTTFLVLLLACVMVSMAKRPGAQCQKKLAKITKKLNNRLVSQRCAQEPTWSTCVDGKMTKSFNLVDPSAVNCTVKEAKELDCVKIIDKKVRKNGCSLTKTMDFTDCANGGNFTVVITSNCTTKITTLAKPCQHDKNEEKGDYMTKFLKFTKERWELACGDNQCHYGNEEDAECDPNTMEMELTKTSGDNCPETLSMPCMAGGKLPKRFNKGVKKQMKRNKKQGKKMERKANKKLNKKQWKLKRKEKRMSKKECKYRKGDWSECDPVTGKQSMQRRLKRGDPNTCQPVHVEERPCRNKGVKSVCKYRRTGWSDCDGATNVKRMVLTLKRGKPDKCDSTKVKEKICKRKHSGLRASGCKYSRGVLSGCDLTTGKQSMRKPLKPGSQSICPPFKLVQRPCKKRPRKRADPCKYKKNGQWGPCDPKSHTKSRNMILVKGNPNICPIKKLLTKQCRQRSKNGGKCKYDKSQWGPCDAASNTVTRTLTLKRGDPAVCNTTRKDTRKCKDKHLRPHVCKYRRTTWDECDPTTNMKKMTKTLKRGDPSLCIQTEILEKKCKKKNKGTGCKYRFEPWSPCVNATNTMTRRQVLESGPQTCPTVKNYSKKCKKPCNFLNGQWSPCDPLSKQMTRVDALKPGSADYCDKTRVLSKKCGKREKRCVYDYGAWSECDESDNPKRSREQTLVSGGENCDKRKVLRKPCNKPNGEVRCFFGPWQEFGQCQNGVQKKHRTVLQGGLECERKGVKMKAC